MRRGEEPLAAALRELSEEVGCTLSEAEKVGELREQWRGAQMTVQVVRGRIVGEIRPDDREIAMAAMFDPGALPADIFTAIAQIAEDYLRN
jgi:8-oxo-dGTP pyrophosphatase MutT (NUDIX family)